MQAAQPKEERMIYHTSRFSAAKYYAFCVIIFAVAYAIYYSINQSYSLFVAASLLAAITIFFSEMKMRLNKVILTASEMTVEAGMLSKRTIRIHYRDVVDIRITQSFFQRIFSYGNAEIGIPGSTIQQNVRQNFSGKGNVKIGSMGSPGKGITVNNIQKIRNMERVILSRKSGQRMHA